MATEKSAIELSPGSKDWIQKYLFLVDNGQIHMPIPRKNKELSVAEYIHLKAIKHGLLFGSNATNIFLRAKNEKRWTSEEKLKFQLFENLLFVYLIKERKFDSSKFIGLLLHFYESLGAREESSFLSLDFLKNKTPISRLEQILTARVEIKSSFISTNKWMNYLKNPFAFLDVILFEIFLDHTIPMENIDVDELKSNVLLVIAEASLSDLIISNREQKLFQTFLTASNLSADKKKQLKAKLDEGVKSEDYYKRYFDSELFRFYLLDIGLLAIYMNDRVLVPEEEFLEEFSQFLSLNNDQYNRAHLAVQQFIVKNKNYLPELAEDSDYGKLVGSLSNRWTKILLRNKDKFIKELSESKELLALVAKSTATTLTDDEKKKMTKQFGDIIKSVPSLAVFMLPGGTILLPIILKITPKLLPSAFQDNKMEE